MLKNFFRNVSYAFVAQIVSLSATLVLTFFASSIIGVEEFAYWQLFLTYVTYVNVSRLGWIDGLYLRLGGERYENLNFKLLSHERRYFLYFQLFVTVVFVFIIMLLDINDDRLFVLISCGICILIVNANNYLSYILQAVNLTKYYSASIVIQNIPWFFALAVILIFNVYTYKVIIIFYIIGMFMSLVYLSFHAKDIVRYAKTEKEIVFDDIKENISCGLPLMVAQYSGSLIISSVRMVVDAGWGVKIFGYFSFSLTLANVFMSFISQAGVVVFPALKSIGEQKRDEVYYMLRNFLSLFLPVLLLAYLPINIVVNIFLPQYQESLKYLPFFLPICIFDGKMQMLCSSFFKSLRKEKTLLVINISTLACSVIIALIGTYAVKSIEFVAYSILFVVALRSIVSDVILARILKQNITAELIQEILIILIFLWVVQNFAMVTYSLIYLIIYVGYLAMNRKRIKKIYMLKNEV